MEIVFLKYTESNVCKLMEDNESIFKNNSVVTVRCFNGIVKEYNNYWNTRNKNNNFNLELMHSSSIDKALIIKRNKFCNKISEEIYFKNFPKYDAFIIEHIIPIIKKYKIKAVVVCGGEKSWEHMPAIYQLFY